MPAELRDLLERVRAATGKDAALDQAIDAALAPDARSTPPAYTSSVDACIDLVHQALPGWGWHVGYGPRGVIPYAALSDRHTRHEASAPTVPLALLAALLQAKIATQEA